MDTLILSLVLCVSLQPWGQAHAQSSYLAPPDLRELPCLRASACCLRAAATRVPRLCLAWLEPWVPGQVCGTLDAWAEPANILHVHARTVSLAVRFYHVFLVLHMHVDLLLRQEWSGSSRATGAASALAGLARTNFQGGSWSSSSLHFALSPGRVRKTFFDSIWVRGAKHVFVKTF